MWLLFYENKVSKIEEAGIPAASGAWGRSIVIVQLWHSLCNKFNIWISSKKASFLYWQYKNPTVSRFLNLILKYGSD